MTKHIQKLHKSSRWGWLIIAYIMTKPLMEADVPEFALLVMVAFIVLAYFFYYWIYPKIKFIKNEWVKWILVGALTIIIAWFLSLATIGLISRLITQEEYGKIEQNIENIAKEKGFNTKEEFMEDFMLQVGLKEADMVERLKSNFEKEDIASTEFIEVPETAKDMQNNISVLYDFIKISEENGKLYQDFYDYAINNFNEIFNAIPNWEETFEEDTMYNFKIFPEIKNVSKKLTKAKVDFYNAQINYYQAHIDDKSDSEIEELSKEWDGKLAIFNQLDQKYENILNTYMTTEQQNEMTEKAKQLLEE